ncbi:MAG: FHA domain-containing [Planctomycetota bacterium]|nr:MAG: FHA domain-containing [Planctomycetota bacterium]
MSIPSDEKFRKLVSKMLFMTPEQLENLRSLQLEASNAGAKLSLFEIAYSDAVLTQEQLDKVQLAGEYTDMLEEERRIGALAIQKGLANDEEIEICIDTQKYEFAAQRALPRRLTEIMVEAEILTAETSAGLMLAYAESPAPGAAPATRKSGSATMRSVGNGSDPTVPYDTKRLEEVEAMAEEVDVPPDLSPDEDTQHNVEPDAAPSMDTPVQGSDPALRTTAPGRNLPADAVTRRLTARLVLETGELTGRIVALTGRGRIGRQMGCMVRIDDSRASREHAQVDYDAQLKHHFVTDLESRNGTYVNDTKIAEPTVLNPGDKIRIGDTVLRYEA